MVEAERGHYYVPHQSYYTLLLSVGVFTLALGFVLKLNGTGAGVWAMLAGFAAMLYVIFRWFGSVISESVGGLYHKWEDKSFRWGMAWFIFSEVMFFAAFFGALYYLRRISVPELATFDPAFTPYPDFTAAWPSAGPKGPSFTPMGAWGIPALNTLILLSSGVTVTWAHWGLLKGKRGQLVLGLAMTVALGALFIGLQAFEYHHAYTELGLTLGAGVYGATFFMLTGFHGFHVTLGTIMLIVIMLRSMKGHFSSENHFGFEAVAWYWHFVDVVWLGLFIFVYWL
jgi:cytochrome c oxidase subunit 3